MTEETHTNVEGNARTDPLGRFKEIRESVEQAQTKEELTELYKRTVYMILMTHSTPVNNKDGEMKKKREMTEKEFTRTVKLINSQAKKLGVEANYSENWENMSSNGYETEDENLLEAQRQTGIVKE